MTARCAVLVVDDDRELRELLAEALELDGFDVKSAADGKQALALLGRWRPHVILLDLNMPEMDGWAFRRAQRAQPSIAAIPVIVFSASFRGGDRIAELDAAAFLSKPCDLDRLVAAVGGIAQREAGQLRRA